MTLLVAGADRVDAGKTTFSVGLVAATGAVGFKPRAGNDYWFDHDDVRQAVTDGRLYGKDASRLAAASGDGLDPEDLNPVHRLWTPSPGSGAGMLGQEAREFVVDRVGEAYIVNGTLELPDPVQEGLPLEDATVVDSLAEFNAAMERFHLAAMERASADVAAAERPVVESYGDIARPYRDIDPDAVAVVEPRRVRIFGGERYLKGCEVAAGGPEEGQLEEHVGSVIELLDPVERVSLPALPADDRRDPAQVATAYEPAYDALLRVAGWR